MSSAVVIVEKQQVAAAVATGGSTSSHRFHSTRSSKILCSSTAVQASSHHRHSRHSNNNADSSSRHSHNGTYTHSSSSRTRSTNSHRNPAVQCLPREIKAKDDQLGTGGGETAKQREKRREEKEKPRDSQRGIRDDKAKKMRHTDGGSSTNGHGRDRSGRHEKGSRAGDAGKEPREEEKPVTAMSSVEKAATLDGGMKSRKDGRSDKVKTTEGRKDCKTDGPLVSREGSSSSSSRLRDAGVLRVAAVSTGNAAAAGGLHRTEKTEEIAPEARQQRTSHSKSHKDRRHRHEHQGESEKNWKELSALPHHKSRRHVSVEAGDRVALETMSTAAVTVEARTRQTADIQASARKATNADSAGGTHGHKEERHQREKRREADASDRRAEKKKRRYADEHEEKKEVAKERKETRRGRKDTDKKPSTSGEMQQREDKRQLQQGGRSPSPLYRDCRPSDSKSSGGPHTRERDSSSSADWKSGTVAESNSNGVTHSSSSSRRDREEAREGERRDKSKRRHRRNDVADAAATATQSSSCAEGRREDWKSFVSQGTPLVAKEKSQRLFLTGVTPTPVEEQQRGNNNDSAALISSSNRETQLSLRVKERRLESSSSEQREKVSAAVEKEDERKKNEKRSSHKIQGRNRRISGSHSSSSSAHAESSSHSSSSRSSKDKGSRRESDSHQKEETRRPSHERHKAEHERKQKDVSSMPAAEADGAVSRGEASCCEERRVKETHQREHQRQQPGGSGAEERCKRKKSNTAMQRQEQRELCEEGGDAACSKRTHAKKGKKSRTSKANRKGSPKERDSASSRPLVMQEEHKMQQQQQPPFENVVQRQLLDDTSDASGDRAAEALRGKEEGGGEKVKQCHTDVVARAGNASAPAVGQPLSGCSAFQTKSRSGSRSHSSTRDGAGSRCVAAAGITREESPGPNLHSSRSNRRSSGSSRNSADSTACCKEVTDSSNPLVAETSRLSVQGTKREGNSRGSTQGSSRSRRHNSSSRRQTVCSTQRHMSSGRHSVRSSSQPEMRNNGEQGRSRTSPKQKTSGNSSSRGRDSRQQATKSSTSKKKKQEQQEEQHIRTNLISEGSGAAGSGQDQFPSLSSSAAAAAAGAASLAAAANAAAATAALRSSRHKMARKGSLAEKSSSSRSSSGSSSGSSVRGRQNRRRSSVRRHQSSRTRSRTCSWDSRSVSSSRSSGRSGSRRDHRQSRRRGRRRRKSISSREGTFSRSRSGSGSRSRSRSRSGSSNSSRSRSSSGSDSSRGRASTSRSCGSGNSTGSGSSRSTSRTRSRSTSRSSSCSSRSSSSGHSSSRSSGSRSESGKSRSRSSIGSNESSWRRRRRRRRSKSRSSSGNSFAILNTSDPTCNSQGDPFPPDLQGPCYVKILPRTRDPPVVLGIDNRGLIRLAKQHGCKMKLSAVDDVFPNTDRRLLLVYGGVTTNCVRALQAWVVKTAIKKQQQPQDKVYSQRNLGSGNSGEQKESQLQGKPASQQQQLRDLSQKRGGKQQQPQQKGRQQQRGPQAPENDYDLETEITFVIAQSALRHMRISPWSSLDLTTPPAAGEAAAAGAGTGDETAAGAAPARTGARGGAATPAAPGDTAKAAPTVAEKSADAGKCEENQQQASGQDAPQQTPGPRQQQQGSREHGPSKKEEEKQSLEQQQPAALQQQVKREHPLQQQREQQQPQFEQQGLSAGQQNFDATCTVTRQQQQPNQAYSNGSTPAQAGTTEAAGASLLRSCTPNMETPSGPAGSASGPADPSAAFSSTAPGCVVHQDESLTERQQEPTNRQAPSVEQQHWTSVEQPSGSLSSQQQGSLLSPGTVSMPPLPPPASLPSGSSVEQQEQTELTPEQVQQQNQRLEQERLLRQRSVWPPGSLLRDLHTIEGAQVKLSRRQEMRWGCRERLVTLRGSVEHVQHALACVSFALQYFLQQRDYMNVKYVRYTEERRRRRRSPSPLPTVPRIVLQEPALPSALVPGLQFQRVLQGLNVQDELVRMTNLRGIIDHHTVEMRGPAYVKVVISDLVTTLLLGTVKSDTENKSCPLRVIEKICGVQAKVMDPEMPGILERVLIISGQPNSVDKATMAVLEKVYAACIMAGQASQVTWRMCASNSAASLIIGTGGHRVKQLRHITNTRIQINTRDNVPVVDRWERVVTITGTYAAVAAAARAMLPFMHADPNHGQHVHQCYGTGTRLEMPEWAEHAVQREGMDEEAGRRPPLPDDRDVSFTGPCFLKLLIDNALANALIGKDSQTIINLSEATQCVMKFAPPTTVFPGCPGERVLGLSGSAEAINSATIAIIEKCKEVHPNLSYDQMYGKMIVPHTCCSSIIGSGGARIREIREATLTRIAVSKKGLNTPERLVCIFGMPQGVHTALVTIFGIIQCDPGIRIMLDIVYPPDIEGDSKKKEANRLSIGLIGAVLEGVQAVVNKVGVDETAEAALKKLQEMQRAAAIAAGELPPDAEGEFRGPLGPMGQTRGTAQHANYSTPISFIPASSHLASTAASEASLAAAVQENGAAVAGGLRALGAPQLGVAVASPHQLQALTFGVPGAGGDAAAAAGMEFPAPWAIGPGAASGDSGHLLQLQGAEGHAPLGISRTGSIYTGGVGRQLVSEDITAPAGEGAAAGEGLSVGGEVAGAMAQQGPWGGAEHTVRQQQHLTRQEKRQRLLEASLNRGLGAAAAREERRLTAGGEHITCGGEEDQHDEDEDLSLAGLMDEKF